MHLRENCREVDLLEEELVHLRRPAIGLCLQSANDVARRTGAKERVERKDRHLVVDGARNVLQRR